jgi:hypothetical protein
MRRHRPRYVPWLGLLLVAGFILIIVTFFYTAISHAGALARAQPSFRMAMRSGGGSGPVASRYSKSAARIGGSSSGHTSVTRARVPC